MKWEYGFKVSLLSDEDGGGYLVEVPDLPGCMTDGDTPEEAFQKLESAIDLWLEMAKESGRKIPEPKYHDSNDPSGKFTARIPKQLHKELMCAAEEQGVSINQLVVYYISKGIHGEHAASREKAKGKEIIVTETVTKVTLSDDEFRNDWDSLGAAKGRINRVFPFRNNDRNHDAMRRLSV